jgi:hypothetical protein
VHGRACVFAGIVLAALVCGCSQQGGSTTQNSVSRALYGPNSGGETLSLKGDVLTVHNLSGQNWTDVEILLNGYYRARASSIPAGERAQAPLAKFVDGYNRPFNPARMASRSFRLTAKLPDGKTFQFEKALY